MSHVKLVFEDVEGGEIAFRAVFTDGENKQSRAHQMANQVIHWLDTQAERKTEESVEEHTPRSPLLA